jgi:hypothetical protein
VAEIGAKISYCRAIYPSTVSKGNQEDKNSSSFSCISLNISDARHQRTFSGSKDFIIWK